MQQLLHRTVNACRRTLNLTMADWDTRLTFVITPKSGPLRKMVRLRDAQQALIADLPSGFLRRAHWLTAGKALVTAAETGKPKDIEWVFESIVAALDEEGWLPQGVSSVTPPRSVVSSNDRVSVGNITPRPPDEPLLCFGVQKLHAETQLASIWLRDVMGVVSTPIQGAAAVRRA